MSRILFISICLSIVNIMMIVGIVMPGDWQASQPALNSADTLTPRLAISNEQLKRAAIKLADTHEDAPGAGTEDDKEIIPRQLGSRVGGGVYSLINWLAWKSVNYWPGRTLSLKNQDWVLARAEKFADALWKYLADQSGGIEGDQASQRTKLLARLVSMFEGNPWADKYSYIILAAINKIGEFRNDKSKIGVFLANVALLSASVLFSFGSRMIGGIVSTAGMIIVLSLLKLRSLKRDLYANLGERWSRNNRGEAKISPVLFLLGFSAIFVWGFNYFAFHADMETLNFSRVLVDKFRDITLAVGVVYVYAILVDLAVDIMGQAYLYLKYPVSRTQVMNGDDDNELGGVADFLTGKLIFEKENNIPAVIQEGHKLIIDGDVTVELPLPSMLPLSNIIDAAI